MVSRRSGKCRQGAILAAAGLALTGPAPAAADFLFKQGSFIKSDVAVPPSAPVEQQVTGVGFQPKAVIFYHTRQSTTGLAGDISGGWGFTTGPSNSRAIAIAAVDNQLSSTADTGKAQSLTSCIVIESDPVLFTGGAKAELVQFEPNGFRLRWTTNEARQDIIHYIALGGSDITNAVASSVQPAAGTGSESFALGFQPDFVVMMTARSGIAEGSTTEAHHSIGFATATAKAALGVQLEDDELFGRDTCVWQRTDSVLLIPGNGAPSDDCAAPGSTLDTHYDIALTATGFDINKLANGLGGSDYVHYLALSGGRYRVGSFAKNNVTAAPPDLDQPVIGTGFRPVGVLLASDNLPANLNVQAQGRVSFGASDLASNGATWWHDRDGLDPTDANMRTSTSHIAVHGSGANGGTIDAAGYLKSFDADGFTVRWTTNNSGAGANHEILYVAFGPSVPTNYRSIGTRPDYGTAEPIEGAGTAVSATRGSRVVTGTGTAWKAANRGRGDRIWIDGIDYVIWNVDSDTQLRLVWPFGGDTGAGKPYVISRQFTGANALQAWEDCIDGPPLVVAPCTYFPPASADLVADNRSEVGIAYRPSPFTAFPGGLVIDGSNTDPTHRITLTVDPGNRHAGVADTAGTGVVIDNTANAADAVLIQDHYVAVEWLEVTGGSSSAHGIVETNLVLTGGNQIVIRNNIVHDVPGDGIRVSDNDANADISNNIVYGARRGIRLNQDLVDGVVVHISNNTVYGSIGTGGPPSGITAAPQILLGAVTLINNIAHSNAGGDFEVSGLDGTSRDNLSSDSSANGPPINHSPADPGINSTQSATTIFVNPTGNPADLHIKPGSDPENQGYDVWFNLGLFRNDIDGGLRSGTWDIGADEIGATTSVNLLSFVATGHEGAVELTWQTASEINNLGFYLYRAEGSSGPFERITPAPIPGLGSSPVGARYRYLDQGVVNGRTYCYLLEDYETTGKTERHGPVSATPQAGTPSPGGGEPDAGGSSDPRITYGDPESNSLRVLERTERGLLVELTTGGFSAEPLPDGSVRLSIPGFVEENSPGSPALPTRRAWLEAWVGKQVQLASVRALDVATFSNLRPLAAEAREIVASRAGTLEAGKRPVGEGDAFRKAQLYPEQPARILDSAFQGETKKALLELAPLRWDPFSQQLLLAKKLLVQLAFTGREPGELSRGGSRGRKYVSRGTDRNRGVLARLGTHQKGLYALRFEDLFDPHRRGFDVSHLRLSRLGESVAFHVQPDPGRFTPGSSLYFLSDGASLNPYGAEAVYELELDQAPGLTMPTASAPPSGPSLPTYLHRLEREENLSFAAQLEVENFWPWANILASTTKSFPFELSRLAPGTETAKLELWVLGVTGTLDTVEHRVRIFLNGQLLAELTWSSRSLELLSLELSPTLLLEGTNTLAIENANSFYSAVVLDRFALSCPRLATAEAGALEGAFSFSGAAELTGFSTPLILLDLTEPSPRWLTGMECSGGVCRFRAEAGHRYLATKAPLRPAIELASPSRLKSTLNRYDYLVLGPQSLLQAAEPLLQHRRTQGLASLAVPMEDVFDEFGFGEQSPQAIRDFLAYAFHRWAPPAPRYVLLLGDGTYDYKDYLHTGTQNQIPPLLFKSSYLWTASDPLYAAVNGTDALPDLAIGRLPASSLEEARTLIDKILAFETTGQNLDGPAVLVSDNPDRAGDFEADANEIATALLASRNPTHISLAQLGTDATRAAILDAFNGGPSLLSYIGHGGTLLWANENIFHTSQIASLAPQTHQPLVLTLNCLNGYFHSPYSDSLAEELLKAEGKGAIAAFSPSGLSLNDAAQVFHKAVLTELTQGNHPRLGDAVLAAQAAYADSGALPELIGIYHLFGDPALRIR